MQQYYTDFMYFNSIKVQLEPAAIAGAGSLIGFQFHKGTIRTQSGAV